MTTIAAPLDTGRSWRPADGVTPRGHVVLLAGRGEHAGVYERFGRRLAYDGYRVSAVSGAGTDELDRALRAGDGVRPLVLAGSDTGALEALTLAGALDVAGVLLAGTPTTSSTPDLAGTDELDARTACPIHRARLHDDVAFVRGRLSAPVPSRLLAAALDARVTVPVLLVHGGADPVAPVAGVRELAGRLPRAELAVVRGGRHDVLNDLHHRTVAGHIVGWLERLRIDRLAVSLWEGS
ncbi:MAG TPA: alpha/beta hydrolase [Micromonosporaceae bacterium]